MASTKKYKVWNCKIVVLIDAELPSGFNAPPRTAAIEAVTSAGIDVWSCFSGWGGKLTESEQEVVDNNVSVNYLAEPCTPKGE